MLDSVEAEGGMGKVRSAARKYRPVQQTNDGSAFARALTPSAPEQQSMAMDTAQ